MKSVKIGRNNGYIFNPEEYGLLYAKSPQAIVFENFVRIYFCSCEIDIQGKYLSYVSYIDMDKNFKEILKINKKIFEKGELGTFDEHGIFPFSPLKIDNKVIYGYTSGWSRRVSVSTETGIGIAISRDGGESFERIGKGPILTCSLEHPFLVVDGYVKKFDNIFHMWYIYGTNWVEFPNEKEADRVYKIGHATSENGINWIKKENEIIASVIELECQALPTVEKYNGKYHMFFCYRYPNDFRKNKERSYRIGYAYSNNLVNWMRRDDLLDLKLSNDEWDSNMMCYPNVFEMEGSFYMLYNGNDFGKTGFGVLKLEGL